MLNSIKPALMQTMRRRWVKRSLLGLAALLVLFGLFGYFALPGIIKTQAEKLVGEKIHRQLHIEKIDISPYTLAADLHGVKLMEADGKTVFVSFEHLRVNLSAQSLLRIATVAQEVRLDKPYVHLVRSAANHYNFDDILASLSSQPASSGEPARFALYNLQVNGGRIEFEDQPVHAQHVVSDLAMGIPFISTLPSQVDVFVEPLLSAKVNGAALLFKGKARPFADTHDAALDLNFADIDLTRYIEYLPFKPRFKLSSARLDVNLDASFRQEKEHPALVLKGVVALKSLTLTELNGQPMIKLPGLAITLDDLNVFSSPLQIAKMQLDQPQIDVVKAADGSINLARLAPPAAATTKTADKRAAQAAPAAAGKPALKLVLGELTIHGGRINYRDRDGARPVQAGVNKFDLTLGRSSLDLGTQQIDIASISSGSADFSLIHDKPTAASATDAKPAVDETKPSGAATPPGYKVNIAKLAIAGWSAHVEDRSLPKTAVTSVTPISLAAENISTANAAAGRIDLKATFNQKGQLSIAGELGLAPLHADLALDLGNVDLMPVQPYVADRVNLLVTRAALSGKGTLKLDQAANGPMQGSFRGSLGIIDVATVDKLSGNDFLRWKSLGFSAVNAQFEPFSLDIGQIALNDFFARVIVDPSGRINLQNIHRGESGEQTSLTEEHVAARPGEAQAGTKPPAAAPAPVQATAPASKPPPVSIRKFTLKGGKVRFSDNFIKPNYTANLENLAGSVSDLSSNADATAQVDLHGSVNSAPLNIVGKINPLRHDLFLDLKADVKGMELAPLSPYSGKYIGYNIEKGKLSFDVVYRMENRQLKAQNRIVLDQLTFGDKIDSPTATSLPVQLAVALLRDRNGVIDLNLPIGGSLDDPQFSIGGIIIQVFVNLITKAITAPFALLGSLFGGGEELSLLEFDPGRHMVAAAGESKLQSLAKALVDRPSLKLEITGRFDPATDRDGLRRVAIERKVKALKLKQLVSSGESADIKTLQIKPDEYPALLAKVYKAADIEKPRNLIGFAKDLPVDEMEKLLMAGMPIKDDELLALANQRAMAAKEWLTTQGAVPAERIFIVAGKSGIGDASVKASASRVDFSLQ